jgi:DNA processing protein
MNIKMLTLDSSDYPEVLRKMAKPPSQLYHTGVPLNKLLKRPAVAIVGTRKISAYGKEVTIRLAGELAEQGVVIISGLAYGVDATAHQAALEAGGLAIAVLPGPLERILPAHNRWLAKQIVEEGGALVSEYSPDEVTFKQNFVARNRLVSGLADAVLITEAAEKSGSLHTANFAIEQNKEVLAVPGNISNFGSVGANNLIKMHKAGLVMSYIDVLNALDLINHKTAARVVRGRNANEQTLLDLLLQGVREGEKLLEASKLSVSEFNQALTMLEIGSKIRPLGGNQWAIY